MNSKQSALLISMFLYGQPHAANRMHYVCAPVAQIPQTQSVTKVISTEPSKPQMSQPTEEERKKAAIVGHVAQIANSLINIAINSKDRSNVGMQVGNVLGNVIGIAMVAGQRNGKAMDLQNAEQYLKSLDEQTKMKIAAIISTEMTKSMKDKGIRT